MNKALHSSLLTVVIAIIAYGAVALYSGGEQVMQAISSLNILVWIEILCLSLGNYLIRFIRWHLYISHNSHFTLSKIKHLAIYIAGFSLTTTPGKAGEAMRSLYLKQFGVPHQRSIGALFVERIMDLFAILLLAGLGASSLSGAQSTLAATMTIGLITLAIVMVKIPKKRMINSAIVKNLPEKLHKIVIFIESMLDNANDLLSFRFIVLGLGLGVLAWLLEGYGLYLVMQEFAFDQTTTSLAIAIYGMSILVGALSFMPGGLGGAEAAMIFMLAKAGFDHSSAIAITYICRLATLWFAMVLGIISFFIMPFIGLKPQIASQLAPQLKPTVKET